MSKFSVILAAAGKSSRFNDPKTKKTFIELRQKPVWLHSAQRFRNRDDVDQIILVISTEDRTSFEQQFSSEIESLQVVVVDGGAERADSVQNGLNAVDPACDFVVIHDAARPCVWEEDIENVFVAATISNAAILATPVSSTLKRSEDGKVVDETVDRRSLWQAQTPQVFARELILGVYANRVGENPTDEAQLVEQAGHPVTLVPGSSQNIKITTQADLDFAAACIDARLNLKLDGPVGNENRLA